MKIQNIIFPKKEICDIKEMYFRISDDAKPESLSVGHGKETELIKLEKGSSFQTDTYFNGLSIDKWKKYTKIRRLSLNIFFKGKMRLVFFHKTYNGKDVHLTKTEEIILESAEVCKKVHEVDFNSSGIVFFRVIAIERTEFYGGYYSADLEGEPNKVKIALDICTYLREQYIFRNCEVINQYIFQSVKYEELKPNLELFIVDNGGSLDKDFFCDNRVHLLKNLNVGGAGGFTRGMLEIKQLEGRQEITHALLMDDDILIDPETIFRTWTFLSVLKNKYSDAFIGGAMLRMDQKYIQEESGAVWDQGYLLSRKQGLDLRSAEACLENEVEEYIDYTAWWYTVLPVSVIREDNLPLPLFFRGDDVEYGLRNAEKIILLNGICVWHEPFGKKYSSSMYYYGMRNRLINNAVHDQAIPLKSVIALIKNQIMEEVYMYRYKNADLLMDGVEDFLRGIEWLKNQKGEQLNERVISRGYCLEKWKSIEQFYNHDLYSQSVTASIKTSFLHKVIRRITINGTFLKSKYDSTTVPMVKNKEINVYRVKQVLNCDPDIGLGFITECDVYTAKNCIRRMRKLLKKIKKYYQRINEEYRTRFREVTNIKFWEEYLQLDK